MRHEHRNWKKLDPVKYYAEHYSSLSRAELQNADSGLYNVLSRRGLLDVVIPEKQEQRPLTEGDPVVYYAKHFAGLSRGQLQRAGKEGDRCYRALKSRGLLDVAIPENQRTRLTEGDPVVYYAKHFAGLSRGQLRRAGKEGSRCYRALKSRGLLDVAIPEKKNRPWNDGDIVVYYNTHFAGLSRGQLRSAGPEGNRCYAALKSRGLLNVAIPVKQEQRQWVDGDPVVYYNKHFAGLSRGQLFNAGRKGRRCYNVLHRQGLLDVAIPLKANTADLEGMLNDIVGDDE